MKCFYHRESDAVGTCKACTKGVCGECAVDVGMGLACRERCEADVRRINDLIGRNIKMMPVSERVMRSQSPGYLITGALAVLGGIVFIVMGLDMRGLGRAGIVSMGVLSVVFGLWYFLVGRRLGRMTG